MPSLQEWIHKLEEGEGTRWIRLAFLFLAIIGLAVTWQIREAKGFYAVEAMDQAQLARNIAEGKGFTTDYIRPISLALIAQKQKETRYDLQQPHPDLANAPLYPTLLAGLMKVLPFQWNMPKTGFLRYQPEVIIGIFNQLLFFLALWQVYALGRSLFEPLVGFVGVMLLALTEVFWDFTTSGLSTMLLMVLFLGVVQALVRIEMLSREENPPGNKILGYSALIGLLLGLLALTRYSMGWLVLPVVGYLLFISGARRVQTAGLALLIFVLCLGPWLVRNYQISGRAFGTAGLAVHHGTFPFPAGRMERSLPSNLALELNRIELDDYARKLFVNTRKALLDDLPKSAGNWIAAFFLAALIVPFRNIALSRLRYFMAGSLVVLLVAQGLGATELSEFAPVLNSENLLVIAMPVLFLFGAGFFIILLDQHEITNLWLRNAVIGSFVLILSLPLLLRFLPPRDYPVKYPPYYPPVIQEVSRWLTPEELMMSDMPWAVGWYGDRQCLLLTRDTGHRPTDDFYKIHDFGKPFKGLYLTPLTTNARYLTEMVQSTEAAWGRFYLDVAVLKNLPRGFPLQIVPPGLLPDQLFLSDRIRWRE